MPGEYYQLRRFMETLGNYHEGYPLLCLPSPEDPRDYQYLRLMGAAAGEPTTIDYRSGLPPVFDQGERGSCVACASTWTLKAYQEIVQGNYPPAGLSTAFLYSMCKQVDGMPAEEGTTPRAALKVLKSHGVCSEEMMPYHLLTDLPAPRTPEIPEPALSAAQDFKIQSYASVCGYADRDRSQALPAIRQALKQQGPLLLALMVSANFIPDEQGMLPLPQGLPQGGHAVGIVGDLPEQEALILRNSWGAAWGQDGYAYLPYGWLEAKNAGGWQVFEAWTAVDMAVARPASRIEISAGAASMLVDGVEEFLEHPAFENEKRLLIAPVRSLASAMGYQVRWYGKKLVLIKPN
jgi:Cysteine protease